MPRPYRCDKIELTHFPNKEVVGQMAREVSALLEVKRSATNVEEAPLVVNWEITRACTLACNHCRSDVMTRRDSRELSFEEACRILDQIKELGSPLVVLTGGDPLMRNDFYDLIRYGTALGLQISANPSGTELVTRTAMNRAAEAGLKRIQFSLDGSSPAIHDGFRQVEGSFKWTMNGLHYAREAGMDVEITTTVSAHNIDDLEQVAQIAERIGCTLWHLYFLVPTVPGQAVDLVDPEEGERVLNWLWGLSGRLPFPVMVIEAPFYGRLARQRSRLASPGVTTPGRTASCEISAGKGLLFIDHTGEVCPSGFLRLSAGNVRESSLGSLYRESALFQEVRNPDRLSGKCRLCQYRRICGGSRARAYCMTGDYLSSDPQCVYVPDMSS